MTDVVLWAHEIQQQFQYRHVCIYRMERGIMDMRHTIHLFLLRYEVLLVLDSLQGARDAPAGSTPGGPGCPPPVVVVSGTATQASSWRAY